MPLQTPCDKISKFIHKSYKPDNLSFRLFGSRVNRDIRIPVTLVKRRDFRLELKSRDGVQIQTKIVKFISFDSLLQVRDGQISEICRLTSKGLSGNLQKSVMHAKLLFCSLRVRSRGNRRIFDRLKNSFIVITMIKTLQY